jgi:hypothetical protein
MLLTKRVNKINIKAMFSSKGIFSPVLTPKVDSAMI